MTSAEKACMGEGCDYDAMKAEGKVGHALAKTVTFAACFRDDTDSPKGDMYREVIADNFTAQEQIRIKAAANCILSGCLKGHIYRGPDATHHFGSIE